MGEKIGAYSFTTIVAMIETLNNKSITKDDIITIFKDDEKYVVIFKRKV